MTFREQIAVLQVAATLADLPEYHAVFSVADVLEWSDQELTLLEALAICLRDITGHEYDTRWRLDDDKREIHMVFTKRPSQAHHFWPNARPWR